MAAGKLLIRPLSFLSSQSFPLPHVRRLSTAVTATSGNPKPSPDNSVSVLHFLRGRGLGDEALAGFPPHLLDAKVGKYLPAKFDLLLTLGFSSPEAANILRYSSLLRNLSLISMQRRLDILQTIVSEADLPRIIKRAPWCFGSSDYVQRMVDNVSKLRGWGVSDAKIKFLLVSQPQFFQLQPQIVEEAADRTEAEFGYRRDSKTFVDAVMILWRFTESTIQSKFRVFESFGWDRSGLIDLFKTYPTCIHLAEATLVKKLGFFMKEVGYDPFCITKHPLILGFSLEKRVRPRFQLVNALKSKSLLPKGLPLYSTLCISEAMFKEKYVVKFMKEEPAICNAYINAVASLKQPASGFVDQSLSLSEA